MTVILTTSAQVSGEEQFDAWCATSLEAQERLDRASKLPGLAAQLQQAFDSEMECWQTLAEEMGKDSGANLAHAPQCAANASDFGLMLAWRKLAADWIAVEKTILVICDDPWLFRELAALGPKLKGPPPSLFFRTLMLALRGFMARTKVAMGLVAEKIRFAGGCRAFSDHASTLLVYGHPTSTQSGHDGYFGDLMIKEPSLLRMLHVDCRGAVAANLVDNQRTFSLHGWGSFYQVARLPFVRWRPDQARTRGVFGWLIRRAAALEGGTGQAAMIHWQTICQDRWIEAKQPDLLVWPWENHGWERNLVVSARARQIATCGYQHSTIGHRELNYCRRPRSSRTDNEPDIIGVNGPTGRETLERYGYSPSRVRDLGSLRAQSFRPLSFDPQGPVFVAVPFDHEIGRQMIEAVRPLAGEAWNFIVKVHPMTPLQFPESPNVRLTEIGLDQQSGVRGVLYAATTVGLEAVLGGLPTIRFEPYGLVPTDPVPLEFGVPSATAENLGIQLKELRRPPAIDPETVFTPADYTGWHEIAVKKL